MTFQLPHSILCDQKMWLSVQCAGVIAVFATHFHSKLQGFQNVLSRKEVKGQQKMKFHNFSMITDIFPKFQDFPCLENALFFKFHDF